MKIGKPLLIAMCVASLGAISLAAPANAEVQVYLRVPPPPVRVEVVPAPRRGQHWSPGYWSARGDRHTWKRGHWERERRGYHYQEPVWTQRDDRWQLQRGSWRKGDRDGDGVPNSQDRSPDNPRRN